ncbi:MAG: N-acetylmuramoyl-L-alanine amidase [Anaerolineae bacterium]|nr:N-acetylmuramoyl-L-alanine amidase [Anaerolineae bacterium]
MAETMAPPAPVRNPYVGPKPFEIRERELFFGRNWESEQLIALVIAHPAVLLYAQSGAGKSSLLNAKVLPELEAQEGCELLPVARVRGDLPPGIRAETITNLYMFNTLMSWAEMTDLQPAQLVTMSLAEFLRQVPRQGDEDGYPVLRVLIFDQFEEMFTFYPERWPEREQFFHQVSDALTADPYLRVMFVIREDYLAPIDAFAEFLPEHLRSRFRMERLESDDALAAVEGPLEKTDRSFVPGVAQRLVNELLKIRVEGAAGQTDEKPGRFIEPVQLQVVLQNLWEALPPDVMEITADSLETFGDVDQALTKFYERAVSDTVQRIGGIRELTEWRLRNWFEDELITPAGTRGLVYRGTRRTGSAPNQAVDMLESHHLIRGERRAGARWYELTHDRFIGPIQRANRRWRISTLKQLAKVTAGLMVAIILVLIAFGPVYNVILQFTQRAELQAVSATATVAIAEVQATSTAVAESVRKDRVRPLRSGLSIGGQDATAGTLGYFAVDERGQVYVISAASVLGSTIDGLILQPGPFDGGQTPNDVIGRLSTNYIPLRGRASVANLTALAALAEGMEFNGGVTGVGPILGTREPELGATIRKLGRATGEQTGRITAVARSVTFDFGTGDLRLEGAAFTDIEGTAGDAGALVFDPEGYAIGIFVMMGEQGVVVPMTTLLDLFEVTLLPPQVQIQDKSALLRHSSGGQYAGRDEASIDSIVIHHTGNPPDVTVERIAEYAVDTLGLPGITYHYCVTADGMVFQTQPLAVIPTQGDREKKETSIDVCLIGNFTDASPPRAQLNATAVLVAQLASTYHIPLTAIFGRSELQPPSASPGQTWLIWRPVLLDLVSKLLAGGVPAPQVTPAPTFTPVPTATPEGGPGN